MLFHTFQIPKQYSVVLSLGWFKGMFTGPPHVVMGKNHVFPIDFPLNQSNDSHASGPTLGI